MAESRESLMGWCGHSPIVTASVVIFSLGCSSFLFGKSSAGDALEFDGTTDYVVLAETAHMLGPGWEHEKTVSLWVRPMGESEGCSDPAHCDAVFGDRPRWWGMSRGIIGGEDNLWIWNYDGSFDVIAVDYVIGSWTHISMVHGGGILRCYKNAVEYGSVPSGATVQPNPGAPILHLGGIINSISKDFTFRGEIDEVAMWNVARSPGQIARDVYDILASNESGLAAYYRMSDGFGTELTDDSVNSWDGSLEDGGRGVVPDGEGADWVDSAVPLVDSNTVLSSFYFPQVADGSDEEGTLQFQSTLILANTGSETSWIKVEFFRSPDGAPMELSLGGLGNDSAFEFRLRSGGSVSLSTPGTGEFQVGYARIGAGEGVGGVLVFRRTDLTAGVSLFEAGVPAATKLREFTIFLDSLGTRDTGFAIVYPPEDSASPSEVPDAVVTIRLYDKQFTLLAEKTLEPLSQEVIWPDTSTRCLKIRRL